MQEDGVWVDKYAYTTAIHASAQMGKWARSVRYLDEMDATGVKKDVVTVSAAISACADKGQWAQVHTHRVRKTAPFMDLPGTSYDKLDRRFVVEAATYIYIR